MTKIMEVYGLGKKYSLNKYDSQATFRESLISNAKNILKKKNEAQNDFWALKDVSFDVNQGDRIGIIGKNGAGKSTLLKLISRITAPSTGTIKVNGRVASLLEVGTGFHPELTGKENIFLNGAILGMKRSEIHKKFDEIVAFAEVEKFLNTPVKRYSSGMYVRLAFAVAAHLESEILIIDEVLAVGDAAFQKKCLGKMDDVTKQGRTILFVSHNMQAINQLCNKYLYLQHGQVQGYGQSEEIVKKYISEFYTSGTQGLKNQVAKIEDKDIKVLDVSLKQHGRTIANCVENGSDFEVELEFEVLNELKGLRVYIDVCDDSENLLIRSFHDESSEEIQPFKTGKYSVKAIVPKHTLGPINYLIRIQAGVYNIRDIFSLYVPLEVENTGIYNKAYLGDSFRGKLAILLPWELQKTK